MTIIRKPTHLQSLPRPMAALTPVTPELAGQRLAEFCRRYPGLFVLTGAGVSTASGIPDYRDHSGAWKRSPPVQHQVFLQEPNIRQRYWARSLAGWRHMRSAMPNAGHTALAALEAHGYVHHLATQNVDRLHQKAGSQAVTDLHGRADWVSCRDCGYCCTRDVMHQRCADLNPEFSNLTAAAAPDGDADLERDFSSFRVPLCPCCGGTLKPDVVFYGDHVPRHRVTRLLEALDGASGLLVAGSSLMVYSGLRFCRRAAANGQPIGILNLGQTRADQLATERINADVTASLNHCLQHLGVKT